LSSHDGSVWNWVPGDEVFETGNFGEWDGGISGSCPIWLKLPKAISSSPYEAYDVPHK